MTNSKPPFFGLIRSILKEYRTAGHVINHTVFESIELNYIYTYRQVLAVQTYMDEHPEFA
jgi:hypothetical protein